MLHIIQHRLDLGVILNAMRFEYGKKTPLATFREIA